MPPIYVLIKPASGSCNLRCKYCFYADITDGRETPSLKWMSDETLEAVVVRTLKYATGQCTFAFQGGEPTLVGLDFYKKLIELEKLHNKKGIRIENAIQTNGYIIDDQWAKFFAENKFLVGLSLDGTQHINDQLRFDSQGKGTFDKIFATSKLFDKYNVEYNILTVVTAQVAKNITQIIKFYKQNNLRYQQYIPCLDPFGEERGKETYSLTPELYAEFLKKSFDLWYKDVKNKKFVFNRYFENIVGMVLGYPPESCGMQGRCAEQYVVESDGGVYPCDFYVMDKYKLGNLVNDEFKTIIENQEKVGFINSSLSVDEKCKSCKWLKLCRGGCRRDRENPCGEVLALNYYCKSYDEFFSYSIERLVEIAKSIR